MSSFEGGLRRRPRQSSFPEFLITQIKKAGPLGFIILLHVMFFYALQSGLLRKVADAVPKEVFATFVTAETPKPETPTPQTVPKTVPVVKKAAPRPVPVEPPVRSDPAERAIAVAPPPASPPPAATPAPQVAASPKTISGVEYLQPPRPDYPPSSRRLGEEGKVMLRVLVNDKGRAEKADIQKSSGFPQLDEAARQAVMRAIFKPYVEDGKPQAVFAIIPIRFQLDS
jgi:protein TonB